LALLIQQQYSVQEFVLMCCCPLLPSLSPPSPYVLALLIQQQYSVQEFVRYWQATLDWFKFCCMSYCMHVVWGMSTCSLSPPPNIHILPVQLYSLPLTCLTIKLVSNQALPPCLPSHHRPTCNRMLTGICADQL
jgi:hypothetical protein